MAIIPKPENTPSLRNEALNTLFLLGPELPPEALTDLLREIPALSLLQDCCDILTWGVRNYERLTAADDAAKETWAVIYAFFLAGATGQAEATAVLLEFLDAPSAVLEFYFGDILTEEAWWPLRQLLPGALDAYIAFLRRRDVDYTAQAAVLYALLYAAYRSEAEAAQIKSELIDFAKERAAQKGSESDDVDFVLTELALCLIDDGAEDALAAGKAVYESGLADESIAGGLKEVLESRGQYPNRFARQPYESAGKAFGRLSLYQRIDSAETFQDLFGADMLPKSLFTNDPSEQYYNPQQPIVKSEKIGRNDPCPCGSGKKYKKCCGKA
jgi:hypothetical protein